MDGRIAVGGGSGISIVLVGFGVGRVGVGVGSVGDGWVFKDGIERVSEVGRSKRIESGRG